MKNRLVIVKDSWARHPLYGFYSRLVYENTVDAKGRLIGGRIIGREYSNDGMER